MRKKDVTLTINRIKNHLRETEQEFSKEVFLNNRDIAENANARGVLHSGMTIGEMIKNIDQVINTKIDITLEFIRNFQKEMNLKYNDEAINKINEQCRNFYTNVYLRAYEGLHETAINYSGKSTAEKILDPMTRDRKLNEMLDKIDYSFKDIKIRNKVQKEDKGIRINNKTLIVYVIMMVVSILALAFSIFSYIFK